MATALKRMDVDEFRAWSEARPNETYELVDGIPRLMAGPSERHGELQLALGAEVRSRLKRPCRVVGPVGFLLDRYNERIPDLSIVCGDRVQGRIEKASIVVEILSDSTAVFDHGEKRLRYMRMPGLDEIWIVASDRRHLMRWWRGPDDRWAVEDLIADDAMLASPYLVEPLPLGPLWAGIGL